jgi:cytoskeletal protein CcmA (bactofilin family)
MRSLTIALSLSFSLLGIAPAAAQLDDIWRAGARVNVQADQHENVWAAGAIVSVRGAVRYDVRAAGAEVAVDAAANRDLWAAGAIVTVNGSAARDMNVAGARVAIDAEVGRELRVAGARVLVGARTIVNGRTRIAGADVVFAGTSNGPAEFYGDHVLIEGRIAGNLLVRGRSVTLAASAVVNGDIVFEVLDEPQIEPGAQITGRQTVTLPRMPRLDTRHVFGALAALGLFAVGAGFVLGLILLIGARGFVERAIERMRSAPVQCGLTGLAVLILVPIVIALIMVTLVGIPVGLLVMLAFPLAMLTGGVLAAFWVSDWLLNRQRSTRGFGARLLFLIVGLVILTVIGLIPIVGFITWLIALLVGLGGLWYAMRNRTAPAPAQSAI